MNDSKPSASLLLEGYPGPAMMISGDCALIAANAKGNGLHALLKNGAAQGIPAMVAQAAKEGRIAGGAIAVKGAKGKITLEITVVPQRDGKSFLVMAKDTTMERNLRNALVESRQRYKDLVEVSSDFSWEVGPDGAFVFVSPRGALGHKAEDMVGRQPEEFVINSQEFSPLPFVNKRAMENVEMWMRKADGSTACVTLSCRPLVNEDGEWRGARGICRDITEERHREDALNQARHRRQLLNYIVGVIRDEVEPTNMLNTAAAAAARALGAAGCGIYRLDASSEFLMAANYGNCKGLNGLEKLLKNLKSNDDVMKEEMGNWRVLAAPTNYRQSINGAIAMWKNIGGEAWEVESQILISDVANQLGIANEQISNHERILKLSRTDGLTGLLNRRAFFEEELPRRMERLKRDGRTAALFYVDMDNFKRVNDVHGHQAGDSALLFLRDILIFFSRPGDVVSRLGGDEFAMWLDGICEDVVKQRVMVLLNESKKLQQFSGDQAHPLGISIGIAMYDPVTGEALADLIVRADEAMYAKKRAGKGGYWMAKPFGSPKTEAAP